MNDKSEHNIFLFDNGQINTYAGLLKDEEQHVDLDLVANLAEAIRIQKEQQIKSEDDMRMRQLDELLKNIL